QVLSTQPAQACLRGRQRVVAGFDVAGVHEPADDLQPPGSCRGLRGRHPASVTGLTCDAVTDRLPARDAPTVMFFVVADHWMVRRTFAVLAASVLLAGCDAGDVLGFGTGDEEDRPSELVFAGCPGGGKETVTVGLTPEEAWGTGSGRRWNRRRRTRTAGLRWTASGSPSLARWRSAFTATT